MTRVITIMLRKSGRIPLAFILAQSLTFLMTSNEFVQKVTELILERDLPYIDQTVYDSAKFNKKRGVYVEISCESDDILILGFLGLLNRFKSLIIRCEDLFYIPTSAILFCLKSSS